MTVVGSLVVVLIVLLVRGNSDSGPSVTDSRDPYGIGVVTGSPIDLLTLPAGAGSDALPSPAPPSESPSARVTPSTPASAPARPRPPTVTSYEAESDINVLAGTRTFTCHGCSGDKKVGNIGAGMGTLQFNGVGAAEGPATVTLVYVNGENTRTADLSVNGGPTASLRFPGTGGWSTVGTLSILVRLRAGANTFRLSNSSSAAPDFDRIVVSIPAR
jgi:hypothetical protein